MSLSPAPLGPGHLRHELEVLHGHWAWYLVLGAAMIALGVAALGTPFLATLTTVTVFGVFLMAGGFAQVFGAFLARRWSGFFTLLLIGILYVVAGMVMLRHPLRAAADLTLVIAVLLIVGGAFRVAASLSSRHPNWGWMLLNGVITLVLGVMIWQQWPASELWVIGTFVGIDLIFNGVTWVTLALTFRRLPVARPSAT